jgi:hypothetical protein
MPTRGSSILPCRPSPSRASPKAISDQANLTRTRDSNFAPSAFHPPSVIQTCPGSPAPALATDGFTIDITSDFPDDFTAAIASTAAEVVGGPSNWQPRSTARTTAPSLYLPSTRRRRRCTTIDLTEDSSPSPDTHVQKKQASGGNQSIPTVISILDDDDDHEQDKVAELARIEQNVTGVKGSDKDLLSKELEKTIQCSLQDEKPKKLAAATCIICMEDTITNMSTTPCGHMFCNQCLYASIRASIRTFNKMYGTCPYCRTEIYLRDIIVLEIKKASKGKERAY